MSQLFLRRLKLVNYKSIGSCEFEPNSLTFLVGPNGSGKSNILDAVRFVAEALNTTLAHAIESRGGINEVRRRSSGHPTHFTITFHFQLGKAQQGEYCFEIGAKSGEGFSIKNERCEITDGQREAPWYFEVTNGEVESNLAEAMPAGATDRLYLVSASGLPQFRPVFEAFSKLNVYNINPQAIRELQSPDAGDVLKRHGENVASVLDRLGGDSAPIATISEFLKKIVPGIEGFKPVSLGNKKTVQFHQHVKGAKRPWKFYANSMSDGTLRALGVLTAIFQAREGKSQPARLIGIEEPEAALHPGAAQILLDALRRASRESQIIVTSHSPDLLDNPDIPWESIYSVESEEGETRIGPIDMVSQSLLRDNLYTAGELLRMNQIEPRGKEDRASDRGEPGS